MLFTRLEPDDVTGAYFLDLSAATLREAAACGHSNRPSQWMGRPAKRGRTAHGDAGGGTMRCGRSGCWNDVRKPRFPEQHELRAFATIENIFICKVFILKLSEEIICRINYFIAFFWNLSIYSIDVLH